MTPSSWTEVVITALKLEKNSKAGRRNLVMTFMLLVLVMLTVIPKTLEIIANAWLSFSGKEPVGYIPDWLVTSIVIATLAMIFICLGFLVFAEEKSKKFK